MTNRIPSQDITDGTSIVLPENHPDLIFLNPNNVLIKKDGAFVFDKYLSTGLTPPEGDSTPPLPEATVKPVMQLDTPQLTDIESIIYEQYYDATSKLVKYKAVLKIRNSSSNPSNVQGVDARIYNPNA